jgi:hypothetical protein
MAERNPEQGLAAKVAEELEKASLLGSMARAAFEKQFAAGKMDPYAWKRMFEKAADRAEAERSKRVP